MHLLPAPFNQYIYTKLEQKSDRNTFITQFTGHNSPTLNQCKAKRPQTEENASLLCPMSIPFQQISFSSVFGLTSALAEKAEKCSSQVSPVSP